jgi:hypothetical protein
MIELCLARDEHPGWDYDAAASMFVRLIVTYLGWLDWDSPRASGNVSARIPVTV